MTAPAVPVKFNNKPMTLLIGLFFMATISLAAAPAVAKLSPAQRIDSKHLGYELQYWVYTPEQDAASALPSLYVTDGAAYLAAGQMEQILDNEIKQGRIQPLHVIFVDSRDPDNLRNNRRNQEFMCNSQYASFYKEELIPAVERQYKSLQDRAQRGIMGLSFGGTNAACFGLLLPDLFSKIGMHSPASGQHLNVLTQMYKKSSFSELKFFHSVGTKNDNLGANRKFHRVLKAKGYQTHFIEVRYGHDWDNWRPLIDDLLQSLYPASLITAN
ncbi:alpha/beta hydrolase [Rheinheimera tangshanensis]|nr:alpha/beta hydrolase-fold protein [Rheinheimera tangshanensis]